MPDTVPLSCLSAGESGAVSVVLGDARTVHRLEEIGLRQGTPIEMVQPGQTCLVRLNGHQVFGLRAEDLFHILVRTGAVA